MTSETGVSVVRRTLRTARRREAFSTFLAVALFVLALALYGFAMLQPLGVREADAGTAPVQRGEALIESVSLFPRTRYDNLITARQYDSAPRYTLTLRLAGKRVAAIMERGVTTPSGWTPQVGQSVLVAYVVGRSGTVYTDSIEPKR